VLANKSLRLVPAGRKDLIFLMTPLKIMIMKKENSVSNKLNTPAKDKEKKQDRKFKSQEEFDDKSHDRLKLESSISNARVSQQRKDSQEGKGRNMNDSQKKQTQQGWNTNRKEPR
jgi:hypothetical protein